MLFSYSPVAFEDNWLHDALVEMLVADMTRVDGGQARLAWPDCIPQPRRALLSSKHGLRDMRVTLLESYEALSPNNRLQVREAMSRQNDLPAIFDDGQPCIALSQLPSAIRKPIKQFFEHAFRLLSDLGLRDHSYAQLYAKLDYKVCAFCGVELLDAPGQKREALDHYLPIAVYPFAGANLRNLSPMGTKCNSRYKAQQNVILDPGNGSRRPCCDPYDSPQLVLSLNNSHPFEGDRVALVTCPDWVIQWEGGDPDKLDTWESVFDISNRYRASSLNPNFGSWIEHFCKWAAQLLNYPNTRLAMRDALIEFAEIIVAEGLADSAFLKRATIQMLASHCNDSEGGVRLFEWLHDQIVERRVPAA